MVRNLYTTSFCFLDSLIPDSTSTDMISVIPVERLDYDKYIYSYLYQNNQNRHVGLMTDKPHSTIEAGQNWVFYAENIVNIEWINGENVIRYCMIDPSEQEAMEYWLIHIVIPIFLTMRKAMYFLHAGAVMMEDRLVAFMAPSFGGKSTLTHYCLERGDALVTDDKLGTFERNGIFYGVPSHPYHRPYRNPEDLGLVAENTIDEPKEITAIYMLEKSSPDAEITIRELKGIEKFSRLHEGAEMNFSLINKEYVRYLSRFANRHRVFSITVPHDLKRLGEVYAQIKAHSAGVCSES